MRQSDHVERMEDVINTNRIFVEKHRRRDSLEGKVV